MTSISWKKPILIQHVGGMGHDPAERLLDRPGVYFFSRRHGEGPYQPFYIGKTMRVRTRLTQYVRNTGPHETRIRSVIEGGPDTHTGLVIPRGARYFHFGYVTPRPGQRAERVIARAERALIQYGLIVGWGLINNQLASAAATRRFNFTGSRYGYLLPGTLVSHK